MKKYIWVFLFLLGCSTHNQLFINSSGDIQRCGTYGYLIIGMSMEEDAYYDCRSDFISIGYIELEKAGLVGITLNKDSFLTITKVHPNSAATSLLFPGDRILSIDDTVPTSLEEANSLLFGMAGSPVIIKIKRNETENNISVMRDFYKNIITLPKSRYDWEY